MEQEIIHTALENIHRFIGIEAFYTKTETLDGEIELHIKGKNHRFVIKAMDEVRNHQLPKLEQYCLQFDNFILVAGKLFPGVKKDLRYKCIPYIEANGNMYMLKNDVFIFIDNQKPIPGYKEKGNRAFTKTGLKVLFQLLQHGEYIHLTQRELAGKAEVGLGNIPQVIDGLKETGYLLPLNNKTYVWENRKALLERWIAEYGTLLRPKLKRERYTCKGQWQDINFNTKLTVWGGEPAADILTNHLRPEKLMIYTRETRMDLIKNYQLIPDKNGEIEVLDLFWNQAEGNIAPPFLVYADLMLEGGKRNKETAKKIYNEFIQPNL